MACEKCATNKSTACSCQNTSYTIPAHAVYGDSTCKLPAEPCDSITCSECVRHCHAEDKWCTQIESTVIDSESGIVSNPLVEVCMYKGERLDQFLQKLALAQSNPSTYKYLVKNFYIESVTGGTNPTIKFIYFDYDPEITFMVLAFAPMGGDFASVPAFTSGAVNPILSNTFTLDGNMVNLIPGNTYMFKLVTYSTGAGMVDPGSVVLHVTIPTT